MLPAPVGPGAGGLAFANASEGLAPVPVEPD